MSRLYVCNTSSDCISSIDIEKFKEEDRITLRKHSIGDRVGPHGICSYKDKLLVANNYSNNISILNRIKGIEESNYYIGVHCNDVIVFKDTAYVICGDINSLIAFDLIEKQIISQIPCGNLPYSICINREKKLLVVSNVENDSITLIDCVNNENIKNIRVGSYPTKAMFTVDGRYVLICESNIGSDYKGSIAVMSLKNYRIITRITAGNSPIDMWCNENLCFVSNFGDGSISLIDINYYRENKNIIVGGMPRAIIKYGNDIYIGDNYNNLLIKVDVASEQKRYIPIGGEPTGMILV